MGSSGSGGKSRKCQQCRMRRIKCDLKLPQCTPCVKVGKICSGAVSGNIFIAVNRSNKDVQVESSQDDNPADSKSNSSGEPQPSLPLVLALGTRSYDPFSSYPVLPYSIEGVDRLVSFYLSVVGPKVISVNPRSTWFPSALTDPLLFQSTLYSSALHFKSQWTAGISQLAIFHKTQLLAMVNSRLRDPERRLSNESIAAVALIVYTEVINGPLEDYLIHMNGLKQMMKMRGSFGISDFKYLLQRMLASSTVFAAIRQNCTEPAPLPGPGGFEIDEECTSAAMDKPIHPSSTIYLSRVLKKLRNYGFEEHVLLVLNDLFHIVILFEQGISQYAAEARQADMDAQLLYTEHRLVKYQSAKFSSENPVQRSFLATSLVFISLFLRDMPVPVLLNEALTKRLRETMVAIDPTSWAEAPPDVMFWMVFMGGIIATGRNERSWFVSQLSKMETGPDFQDWSSIKALLQSVLWVYKIPEGPCEILWDEVMMSKNEETAPT